MKMKRLMTIFLATVFTCACFGLCACGEKKEEEEKEIPDVYSQIEDFDFTNPAHVKYFGRTYVEGTGVVFHYSASGFEVRFTGTSAQVTVEATNYENNTYRPYVYVLTDGQKPQDSEPIALTEKSTVLKVEGLTDGLHAIRVVRCSEINAGKTKLTAAATDGSFVTPKRTTRKMLVFGDSITCGYGIVNSTEADGYSTASQDALLTYAGLAATAFGAECSFVSKSGIAMQESIWSSEENIQWLHSIITPANPKPYDAQSFIPDIIVINAGANDNSFINAAVNLRELNIRRNAFIQGYARFLKTLRKDYPSAQIYCVTGMLGESNTMLPAIQSAIESAGEDKQCVLFDLPAMSKQDGYGADNHPNHVTHRAAFEVLKAKITEISGWKEI